MSLDVLSLVNARQGHFLLESGHHGTLWLDLERLCLYPERAHAAARDLASKLASFNLEVICGPLVEGAFLALLVALELNLPFTYSERYTKPSSNGLFPSGYRIPQSLRAELQGKRVAIVNDVINAGSAVKGTYIDLHACNARVTAIATLLTLGDSAQLFAAANSIPLLTLAHRPNQIWPPETCPLCARSVPLESASASQTPNPKPQTLNPKPQTPNPKPQTPNPKPQTPNPKPQP